MENKGNRSRALGVLCLVAAMGSGIFSCAEAAEELTDYDLGETVVTATKTKLSEKKVPMSTTVITAEEMKQKGAYNVRDAIKNAVSIDVSRNGTSMVGNNVSIRGMGTTETLILVDGRRIAGEDSASTMNAYELDRLNVNNIERVEILRGSGSAIWGSDATGGVINIITKKDQPAGGYAGVRTGSLESSVYGGFSTGNVGKLNLDVDFNLTKVRRETNEGSTNQYGPRRNISFHGDYKFNDHSGLDFGASFMKEQMTSLAASTTAGSTTSYYDNNRSDYHLKYYGFDNKNDWEVQSYYSRLGKVGRTRSETSWTDFNHARYSTWVNEARNTYRMDKHNTLTYGMEFKNQKAGGTRFANAGGGTRVEEYLGMESPYGSASQNSYSFYLQDEIELGDRLFFVPSVRFDHHGSFGSEWSPRVGMTYNLSKASRIKVNYGKAFRAPTIFELYSQMIHSPIARMRVIVEGNPDLEPEKSTNFDISLEGEKGKATGKLTYFHNKISNLIDSQAEFRGFMNGAMTFIYRYRNVDKATFDGLEAETKYRFDKHWSARANYTYLDARDDNTGSRLTGRALNTGTVELSWTDAKKDPWTATLYNQWYQNYLTSANNKSYSYSLTNFVVTKDIGKMSLYAGVDNLFNKKFDSTDSIWTDGRVWRAGMEWKF